MVSSPAFNVSALWRLAFFLLDLLLYSAETDVVAEKAGLFPFF